MKKIYWVFIVVSFLIIVWIFVRFIIGGSEDDWIKDSRGVWIKHGNPAETPNYVFEQQEIINCALNLYGKAALSSVIQLNSQCLGTCGDYAVDVVHIPRNQDDDKLENQCEDYREGKVQHFIELDRDGEIVRVM